MTVELRNASIADLDGIVRVFLACWRESYRGVLPVPAIEAMSDERARALWQRVLGSEIGEVLVAERTGTGTELLGLTRFAASGDRGDVHSLYVSPEAQGLGVGRRLLGAARDRLVSLGATDARLWVFANNAASLGFYRAQGWLPDGGERTQEEFGERELRLATRLDGAR
ncbi:MAG: GNAT family N-acetyltransferase [Homoserinimonas sp.]